MTWIDITKMERRGVTIAPCNMGRIVDAEMLDDLINYCVI